MVDRFAVDVQDQSRFRVLGERTFGIASMDLDVTVLEPPELIERAAALAARLTAATQGRRQLASST